MSSNVASRANKGIEKVKTELKPTLITNYKVWPAVQVLNFTVVPLKLQVFLSLAPATLCICLPRPSTSCICLAAPRHAHTCTDSLPYPSGKLFFGASYPPRSRFDTKCAVVRVQVLFVNCVAVWWNFVLSMTQHK